MSTDAERKFCLQTREMAILTGKHNEKGRTLKEKAEIIDRIKIVASRRDVHKRNSGPYTPIGDGPEQCHAFDALKDAAARDSSLDSEIRIR